MRVILRAQIHLEHQSTIFDTNRGELSSLFTKAIISGYYGFLNLIISL